MPIDSGVTFSFWHDVITSLSIPAFARLPSRPNTIRVGHVLPLAISLVVSHFLRKCPAYADLRSQFYDHVLSEIFSDSSCQYLKQWFLDTTDDQRWQWFLGGDMFQLSEEAAVRGDKPFDDWHKALYKTSKSPQIQQKVNRAVQHFLILAMRERDRVCGGLRMVYP